MIESLAFHQFAEPEAEPRPFFLQLQTYLRYEVRDRLAHPKQDVLCTNLL